MVLKKFAVLSLVAAMVMAFAFTTVGTHEALNNGTGPVTPVAPSTDF